MFFCKGCCHVLTKIITIEDRDTKIRESCGVRLECEVVKKSDLEYQGFNPDPEITVQFELCMAAIGCPHKEIK